MGRGDEMNTNVIPDIPRYYTAIAEWLSCIVIIFILQPKLKPKKLVPLAIAYLVALVTFMELTATVVIWLWIPCMLIAFVLIAGFIYITTKQSFYKSAYFAVMAFTTAELIASVEWQLVNFFYDDISLMPKLIELLMLVVVYGLLLFAEYRLIKLKSGVGKRLKIGNSEWLTALFIGVIVFACSNLRFVTDEIFIPGQYSREIATARTLIDITGVAMLYAHYVSCCNNSVLRELDAVQQTLHTQYQQYKQSRESIDLINMKYHDFKHQIQFLRAEPDSEKRNEFLDKLESDIKRFELQNKTGNAVLDTIITGKGLYCYKHGITMTTVVDGKILDFMEVADICNIFGNALDNAIESVLKIEDKEKRLIHVTVSKVNDFAMIRIENYYEGELKFDGDDLVSTKGDVRNHGYGIKSIKYTADRYDGAVYINADNNWFDIKIAIPINS